MDLWKRILHDHALGETTKEHCKICFVNFWAPFQVPPSKSTWAVTSVSMSCSFAFQLLHRLVPPTSLLLLEPFEDWGNCFCSIYNSAWPHLVCQQFLVLTCYPWPLHSLSPRSTLFNHWFSHRIWFILQIMSIFRWKKIKNYAELENFQRIEIFSFLSHHDQKSLIQNLSVLYISWHNGNMVDWKYEVAILEPFNVLGDTNEPSVAIILQGL